MNLYSLTRPLLFSLPPETAHHFTMGALKLQHALGLLGKPASNGEGVKLMGLNFPNPVGLAAGLDKNGDYIDPLAALGFGFIEVGTVTPRPQPGNPKPRMFRLPRAEAIINRMGFNNKGIDHLVGQLKQSRYQGIIGVNIGKNFDTPNEQAIEDYQIGLRKAYPYASYIAINISSPNTKKLRELQQPDQLERLLGALKSDQQQLQREHGRYVPLVVKIAPDLDREEVQQIADLLKKHQLDGVIATNTTLARDKVAGLPHGDEAGGLSGAPVKKQATRVVKQLADELAGAIPIIAVGGILSAADAAEKMAAGASLVQLYSGLIYRGPGLIQEVIEALNNR